jgi:hypothetical protein
MGFSAAWPYSCQLNAGNKIAGTPSTVEYVLLASNWRHPIPPGGYPGVPDEVGTASFTLGRPILPPGCTLPPTGLLMRYEIELKTVVTDTYTNDFMATHDFHVATDPGATAIVTSPVTEVYIDWFYG